MTERTIRSDELIEFETNRGAACACANASQHTKARAATRGSIVNINRTIDVHKLKLWPVVLHHLACARRNSQSPSRAREDAFEIKL